VLFRSFSGDQLQRADDCALLAETATLASMETVLADLCFTAKFLHKTFALMMRIGSLGDGYDKLSMEFESNTEKARTMLSALSEAMPSGERDRFTLEYLEVSGPAFEAMMELVHDLNWMKNYSLETKARS
jgi:hypothetical protein